MTKQEVVELFTKSIKGKEEEYEQKAKDMGYIALKQKVYPQALNILLMRMPTQVKTFEEYFQSLNYPELLDMIPQSDEILHAVLKSEKHFKLFQKHILDSGEKLEYHL